jgi:hypothetical protein
MSQVTRENNLEESLKFLRKYDQFDVVLLFLKECRESKFQALESKLDGDERADAKLIGAMIEDDYIYKTLKGDK